jgi:dolichol-phosphate mannosyltransferase
MIDCSIIVPVYYNEESLRLTFNEIHSKVIKPSNYTFEIIFIDDGSGDNSFEVLLELKSEHSDLIKVIKLSRNFGQLSAILSGFSIASGKNLVCISADLQDPPELILEFLEHRENHQIVIAVRENRDEGYYRTATSAIFYWLMRKLALKNIPSGGFDYFLISSKIKDSILEKNEANAFFQGQILWTGFKPKFIHYRRRTRRHGTSRWTFFKKLKMLIDGVLAYSYLPIRLTSLLGLMISAGGFFYAILVIIGRITGRTPFIGYAPIIILILILSGFQMIMLGVIGEYLWRTLDQVRNRSPYVIDKIYD